MEYYLSNLTNFKNSFVLTDLKVVWHSYLPLGGLLTDIPDHHRLLCLKLHGHKAEVELVREVKHGTAATSANGNYEFLTLSHDHQVIGIVRFGLWEELDDVGDLHAWGNLGRHLVDVLGLALGGGGLHGAHGACRPLRCDH